MSFKGGKISRVGRGTPRTLTGLTNALWFGTGVLIVIFFLLGNIETTLDFRTTVAFGFAYLFSWFYLKYLESNFRGCKARVCRDPKNSPDAFWQADLTKRNLIWVPLGAAGVFGAVILTAPLPPPFGTIAGIGLSGAIMMAILLRFNAVLLVIFIHGIYNGLVVSIQLGFIKTGGLTFLAPLSQSPLNVPVVGFGASFDQLANVATEVIFQFMLVSTSEELLKVALTAFFIIAFRGFFSQQGGIKYLAGGLAVSVWVVLHTIQAISV